MQQEKQPRQPPTRAWTPALDDPLALRRDLPNPVAQLVGTVPAGKLVRIRLRQEFRALLGATLQTLIAPLSLDASLAEGAEELERVGEDNKMCLHSLRRGPRTTRLLQM